MKSKICVGCKKEFNTNKYNKKYCSEKCRKECYQKDYWEKRKLDKCVICGFPYFTDRHHIIKKTEWGSNSDENCVLLCKNHHVMADSLYFCDLMKSLIKKKTGKVGEKLSKADTIFLKNEIVSNILEDNPKTFDDNLSENSWLFNYERNIMISRGDFYSRLQKSDTSLNNKNLNKIGSKQKWLVQK